MASGEMIVLKLNEKFGEHEQFTEELGEKMRQQILLDSQEGRIKEYNSAAGLFMLFDQDGSVPTPNMSNKITESRVKDPHIRRLIEEMKEEWYGMAVTKS